MEYSIIRKWRKRNKWHCSIDYGGILAVGEHASLEQVEQEAINDAEQIAGEMIKGMVCAFAHGVGKQPNKVFKNGKYHKLTTAEHTALMCFEHPWRFNMSALLREKNGKAKIVTHSNVGDDEKQEPFQYEKFSAKQLHGVHVELLNELDKKGLADLLVNVAWCARADGGLMTDDEISDTYTAIGAWDDYVAPWQVSDVGAEK